MRFIVATQETNGDVAGDFTFCVEGELVTLDEPCDRDTRDPAGGCGCGRAFSGLHSHRATTTARVAELELSEADVREAIRSSLEAGGWLDPRIGTSESNRAMVDEAFERGHQIAEHFPVGSVIGRRLDQVFARLVASAP